MCSGMCWCAIDAWYVFRAAFPNAVVKNGAGSDCSDVEGGAFSDSSLPNTPPSSASPAAAYNRAGASRPERSTESKSTGRPRSQYEPLPNSQYYRSQNLLSRPRLTELMLGLRTVEQEKGVADSKEAPEVIRESGGVDADLQEQKPGEDADEDPVNGYQFGMWEGVFIRCLLSIWGVIMFLRLSWVIGNCGIGEGTLVIVFSVTVTTITTISLSAICTNGEIKGGGAYFVISRALGPEMGGAIGLTFFAANTVSVSLYLLGFGETLTAITSGTMTTLQWDQRIYAVFGLIAMMGVALTGAQYEVKMQKVLLVVMILALISLFAGVFEAKAGESGTITGISSKTFASNWGPQFSAGESWVSIFGVFFPAVTGITAGANISGDLKDPQKAIPRGTLLAVFVSTIVYLIMAWLLGATVTRSGLKDIDAHIAVVELSSVKALVYAGIFAATLSSALAQLIGAPRILMALARDKLFPFLSPFALGHGENDEPIRGYVLTCAIALVCIIGGDLNTVSPVITNFFLLSYALINYSCAAATWARSPGWRPTFYYYDPRVAAFGAALCIIVMLMVDWVAAGLTMILCFILYKYLDFTKPDVNWGSAGHAYRHIITVGNIYKLEQTKDHVKNYRPQYLVLVGKHSDPSSLSLVRFISYLSEGHGALVVGHVILGKYSEKVCEHADAQKLSVRVDGDIVGMSETVVAPTILEGCTALFQLAGLGKLRPNTVIMGYKASWIDASNDEVEDYVGLIRGAFSAERAVGIMRNADLLDPSQSRSSGGTIDVWWLFEDGGLTILLPYLLNKHPLWRGLRLRILTHATQSSMNMEKERMQKLLRRFRIQGELVVVLSETDKPSEDTCAKFAKMAQIRTHFDITDDKVGTKYFLRMSEILHEHSNSAKLVVVSLPVPRFDVAARKYMSYLELMSAGQPPTLLLRGNQESVLTFES